MLEPSTLTQMKQTGARVKFTEQWIQISQMEWVSWLTGSLNGVRDLCCSMYVLSMICIQNVKLVMKEMLAGQCQECYCLSHDVFP